MTIERVGGWDSDIEIHCDVCGNVFASGTNNFQDARAEAKRNGWGTWKHDDSGEWLNYCSLNCRSELQGN